MKRSFPKQLTLNGNRLIGDDGLTLPSSSYPADFASELIRRYNAHQDMLAALEHAEGTLRGHHCHNDASAMRAAIAKARGTLTMDKPQTTTAEHIMKARFLCADVKWTLLQMLIANEEDTDLHDWLFSAKVGDKYESGMGENVERLA